MKDERGDECGRRRSEVVGRWKESERRGISETEATKARQTNDEVQTRVGDRVWFLSRLGRQLLYFRPIVVAVIGCRPCTASILPVVWDEREG